MDIVFFDASVLYKAAVTRFLLGAERVGEFRAAWSEVVIDEARRNLVADGRKGALAAFEQNLRWPREAVIADAAAEVVASLLRTDAKDRHVLAAAAAAGAAALVTANMRDFDVAEAAALRIQLWTPDEFAVDLAGRNPFALVRYVDRVPPDRFDRYIQRLSRELPAAMELLAPSFEQ